MRVKDLMTTSGLLTVGSDETLELAAQMLLWAEVSQLPVVNRAGKVVGVIGDHDLIGRTDLSQLISLAMSQPSITTGPMDDLADAAAKMAAHGLSSLPVVEDGHLVGVLTTGDLLRQLVGRIVAPPGDGSPAVESVMTTQVATARADDLLIDAVARMSSLGVRHLPVVDGDGQLVGILSDRDVRGAIGGAEIALESRAARTRVRAMRVSSVMTRDPLALTTTSTLKQAGRLLVEHRIGAAPVIDDERRLVGIVSYVDLLRATLGAPG